MRLYECLRNGQSLHQDYLDVQINQGAPPDSVLSSSTGEAQVLESIDSRGYYAQKRDLRPPERVAARPFINGDDKSVHRLVHSEPQSGTALKKKIMAAIV
ncbi:hypothetical protein ACFX15_006171 [Malus domestica]